MNFKRKEEIYKLRKEVIKGTNGPYQRTHLLAYAYLRGMPYAKVENNTEGDTYCETGKNTYYRNLAYLVSRHLEKTLGFDHDDEKFLVREWINKHTFRLKEVA